MSYKINFKIYNLNILQESKTAWENDEIRNPRLSLNGIKSSEMTLDEAEDFIIEKIRKSFKDLKEVIIINNFSEAKLIMPAFQMCSDDKLDIIDFGFNIINPNNDQNEYAGDDYVDDDETISEFDHPSEMWEEFAQMIEEELEDYMKETNISYANPVDLEEKYQKSFSNELNEDEDKEKLQDELDFIKKSINGEI
jgi:hypothetical protein